MFLDWDLAPVEFTKFNDAIQSHPKAHPPILAVRSYEKFLLELFE
jgi:hypothetical protein